MTEKGQTVSVGSGALFGFWFLEKGANFICVSQNVRVTSERKHESRQHFFFTPRRMVGEPPTQSNFFLRRRPLGISNLSFSVAREASTPNRRQKQSSKATRASKALRPPPGSFDRMLDRRTESLFCRTSKMSHTTSWRGSCCSEHEP